MKLIIAHGITYSTIDNVYKMTDLGDDIEVVAPMHETLTITNITPITRDDRQPFIIRIPKRDLKSFNYSL